MYLYAIPLNFHLHDSVILLNSSLYQTVAKETVNIFAKNHIFLDFFYFHKHFIDAGIQLSEFIYLLKGNFAKMLFLLMTFAR